MASIQEFPNLVFEGHSTDYQTKIKLRELVEDGVGILKVGPALTFAMREGMFALENIEKELIYGTDIAPSGFQDALEAEMLKEGKHWRKHYQGTELELRMKRKYSFSDRCRYYMPTPAVEAAKAGLAASLPEMAAATSGGIVSKTGLLSAVCFGASGTKVPSGISTPSRGVFST